VIFHTGWISLIGKDDKRYSAGDRLGVEGAILTGKGVVAIAPTPGRSKSFRSNPRTWFEVHQILLPMNGTYILENMDTAELAKDKAYEFLYCPRPATLPRRCAEHDQPGRDPLRPAFEGWRAFPHGRHAMTGFACATHRVLSGAMPAPILPLMKP